MNGTKPFTKSYAINRIAELLEENKRLKNNIDLMSKYNGENFDETLKFRQALEDIRIIVEKNKKEVCKDCELEGTDFCEPDCFKFETEILNKINEVLK